jgi:N-acetylmuramoyl-L-alanine amidase
LYKICLDPGHGGYDPGAMGHGLKEKDLTLDIALRLRSLLIENGIDVIMTREADYAPGHLENNINGELQKRCDIANDFQANLFISLHINSSEIDSPNGTEILIAGLGGEAEKLANKMLPYLVGLGLKNRSVKVQNIYVLKDEHTAMPAILTETCFISNTKDAERLANPAFLQKIAIAHAKGIMEYFKINNGGSNTMKIAILKFTPEDEWAAKDIDAKYGGIANYTRQGAGKVIPLNAMLAEQLIVIGGPTTKHPNEILLSGKDKYETAAKVAEYLKH